VETHEHLSYAAIRAFLDAVDAVLNSNTFLLHIPQANSQMPVQQWQSQVENYLTSEQFDEDLLQQDVLRCWDNFTRSKSSSKYFKRKNRVQFKKSSITSNYLQAMLTDERIVMIPETLMPFYSPYRKGLKPQEANSLVRDFTSGLFAQEIWQLWTLSPDFLYSKGESRSLEQPISFLTYFEGSNCMATDSASLLISPQKAFLLLTNGVD